MNRRPSRVFRVTVSCALLLACLVVLCPGGLRSSAAGAASARISITPASATPGSLISVSGSNFQPGEAVNLGFDLTPLANVVADGSGVVPTTAISVPLNASLASHTIYAFGLSSHIVATATVTIHALAPAITLNASIFDVKRVACINGSGFGATELLLVTINKQLVTGGQATSDGTIDNLCFQMPTSIVSGDNLLTVQGLSTGAKASAHFTGVLPLSYSYYFAGGSTIGGDTTEMPVLNPGTLRARMQLTIYTRYGSPIHKTVGVEAQSRATIPIGTMAGTGTVFGVEVHADKPLTAQLVVHRSAKAPYAVAGTTALGTTWYLAEGYTGGTFHELVHMLNPGSADAVVQIEAVPSGTDKPRSEYYVVPARHIATLELNRLFPRRSISAIVTSNKPILITRVMTFGPKGYGANANAGVAKTQRNWYYPTAAISGTQTYLSVLNPSKNQRATLSINMYQDTGQTLFLHSERIAPLAHASIALNDVLLGVVPTTSTVQFSLSITSSVPLVLERAVYYGNPDTQQVGSSTVTGPSSAGYTLNFASGETITGTNEFISVSNPGQQPAEVKVTYFMTDGTSKSASYALSGRGRTTINSALAVAGVAGTVHGVQVSSTNFVPIVAEQGLYSPGFTAGYAVMGNSS